MCVCDSILFGFSLLFKCYEWQLIVFLFHSRGLILIFAAQVDKKYSGFRRLGAVHIVWMVWKLIN